MNSFAAVILAAGRSRRMKRPKLLLPWGDTTILGHHVRIWQALGAQQIGIVIARSHHEFEEELRRPEYAPVDIITHELAFPERFDSVLCASAWAGWKPDLTHWIVVLGDQPQIGHATLSELIEFSNRHPNKICLPYYHDQPQHPVVLPKWAWPQLLLMPHYQSFREFLAEHEPACAHLECGDEAVAEDIDRPVDYFRLGVLMPAPAASGGRAER